ncbi:hypothetical protein D3C87_493530 [compost metagenome]
MMKKKAIPSIAYISGMPCVTISMNTPLHSNNYSELEQELKRLVQKALALVLEKYGNLSLTTMREKIDKTAQQIDFSKPLKSVTLFVSENVQQVLPSLWEVPQNRVWVADYFDIRPLISVCNTSEEYFIIRLDHKHVRLYHAFNNTIVEEIKDVIYPMVIPLAVIQALKSNKMENKISVAFFDDMDRQLIRRYNLADMRYVIAGSPISYNRFIQHVRFRFIYAGFIPASTEMALEKLAIKSWEILLKQQKKEIRQKVALIRSLISNGNILTRYSEILDAARQGKGELLLINEDVAIKEEQGDVSCEIVWDVIKHRGKVIFTGREEMDGIAPMALKLKQ